MKNPLISSAQPGPLKGIRADIYRHDLNSTMNILRGFNQIVIVGEGIEGDAIASEFSPAVEIGRVSFQGETFTHLRPVSHRGKWMMFGGDFVYSNQPDFRRVFGDAHLKLHDRYEGKTLNQRFSTTEGQGVRFGVGLFHLTAFHLFSPARAVLSKGDKSRADHKQG